MPFKQSIVRKFNPPIDPNGIAPVSNDISGRNADEINFLKTLTYGLLYILFIGFAGCFIAVTAMLVDSFNNKASTYQQLFNKVAEQNVKLDNLGENMTQLKLKIESIPTKK